MKETLLVLCAIVVVTLFAISANADSIDTLSSWNGTGGAGPLGEGWTGADWSANNFAQTFKIKSSDAKLNAISFGIMNYAPKYSSSNQFCEFDVSIFKWDGSKPTGSALYKSNPVMSTIGSAWAVLNVPLGDVLVKRDLQYIAIFDATPYLDGIESYAVFSATYPNTYPDGAFYTNVAYHPGEEFTGYWSLNPSVLNLRIDYTPVPEPGTILLIGLGGMFLRRRK
jgi:hypothetical protein